MSILLIDVVTYSASEEHKEKSQTPLELFSSTPIVGGALSPLTSDLYSSSPVTMGKSSAFSGTCILFVI